MQKAELVQRGKIIDVQLCGSVIVVCMETADGESVSVYFDHRMFQHLIASEGCSVPELLGRGAEFDGETFILTA